MKVEILKCCSGLKFSVSCGDVCDLPNDTANDLLSAGYAKKAKSKSGNNTASENESDTDDKTDNSSDNGTDKP